MMKAYLFRSTRLIIFQIFSFGLSTTAQPFIEFQKSYGGSESEGATGGIRNQIGGYTLVGSTVSTDGQVTGYHPGACPNGFACEDIWVVNTDSLGNIIWEHCYGGSGEDYPTSIAPTMDGGSIICSSTESIDGDVTGNIGVGSQASWIIKLNALGALQWEKCIGFSHYDYPFDIIATFDGGYVFCGDANHSGATNAWVVKLDSAGNVLWSREYGGSGDEWAWSIIQTYDSGYAFIGRTWSYDLQLSGSGHHGWSDYMLARLDPNGNLLWAKCFGGSSYEEGYDLKQTPDSGFILVGHTGSRDGQVSFNHDSSYADIWVVKTDKVGNLEWEKSIGGSELDYGVSVLVLADSSYLVSGHVTSWDGDAITNHGGFDFLLTKLDYSGQLIWSQCYGGAGSDANGGIIEAGQNRWMMYGSSSHNSGDVSGNHGSADFWLVKLYKHPPVEAGIHLIPIEEICILSDSEQVSIMVINNGESNFYNFSVSYSVNGVSWVTEFITDTVQPQDTLHYIFQTPADLSAIGHYRITANVSVAGDIHAFNDSSSFEVNSINHLIVPLSMGFEDHEINTGWYSHDLDGDGRTGIFNTHRPHSGSKDYTFWAAITLTPDNVLWRSCIDLNASSNYVLSYWTRVYDSTYPYSLEVYLNTVPELAGATLISTAPVATDTVYHQIFSAFTVPQSGTYYIGFRAFAFNTTSLLYLDDILIDFNTSISENETRPDLIIFPNPATGHITVHGLKLNDEIKVFGIAANLVMQVTASHTQEKISLSGITPGMYLIEVEGARRAKFVKN